MVGVARKPRMCMDSLRIWMMSTYVRESGESFIVVRGAGSQRRHRYQVRGEYPSGSQWLPDMRLLLRASIRCSGCPIYILDSGHPPSLSVDFKTGSGGDNPGIHDSTPVRSDQQPGGGLVMLYEESRSALHACPGVNWWSSRPQSE